MTRLEKCELLKSKGYTYDSETGKIFNRFGKELTAKNKKGYIIISVSYNPFKTVYGHHFAWFMNYNNVDFIELDHHNRIPNDNRISNLRMLTKSQQNQNRNFKGVSWHIHHKKWFARIMVNGKAIILGRFNTEDEAKQSYLEAKRKYHII